MTFKNLILLFTVKSKEPTFGDFLLLQVKQMLSAYMISFLLYLLLTHVFGIAISIGLNILIFSIGIIFEELSRWMFIYNADRKFLYGLIFALYISIIEVLFYSVKFTIGYYNNDFDIYQRSIYYILFVFIVMRFCAFLMHVIFSVVCAASYKVKYIYLLIMFAIVTALHIIYDLSLSKITNIIFGVT